MGKVYECIDESIRAFIERQPMFFVATAPRSDSGMVNVSPKGLDSLRVLDDQTVVYADLIGSGIETVAHVNENGRITIMFCAFEGAPKIVRLHGRGEVLDPNHPEYAGLADAFPPFTGLRCFIRVRCQRISDSCGFGVPLFEYQGQREVLTDWADRKGSPQLAEYVRAKNSTSIDGLPGMQLGTDEP